MEARKFDKKKYDNDYIKEKKDRINFVMPKGRKAEIAEAAKAAGMSAAAWINEAIQNKLSEGETSHIEFNQKPEAQEAVRYPDEIADITDLEVYAKSAGQTVGEYIAQAIRERMERQDAEYTEDVERVNLDDMA